MNKYFFFCSKLFIEGDIMENLFIKLNNIIKEYDSFIIMGHKDPDLDSLGSSLGLCEIIETFGKKAYLFLDDKHLDDYNTNINQCFLKMEKNIICVNEKSYKKIQGKTLVIITDVHIKERLEFPNICEQYDLVVLDHHIKNKNYIKNTKLIYMDSTLSSMSELIVNYADYLNLKLDSVIATILLAGIEIDTNGFNIKTTSSTYKTAALLIEMGADTILKQELLKETKEQYMKRASYIRSSFMINDNMAMCILTGVVDSLTLASVAEEILGFEDIEASFTIGKIESNVIGVSARSLGEFNVSEVMKQMGGGGHSSNAATQIKGKTLKEVKQKIIDIIKNESNS